MRFIGIIALSKNTRVIGKDGGLPWRIKEDMRFFKEKTQNSNVIMGRKTWESLGVPHLSNRVLWVMTKANPFGWIQLMAPQGNAQTNIFTRVQDLPDQDYFVAGGLQIYNEFMGAIDEFFVTYINEDYEGDTTMPNFEDNFKNSEIIMTTPAFEIKRLFGRK